MRVYRDPATGRFTSPPTVTTVTPGATQSQVASRRLSAGLVETVSPQGGVVVNLQGRFDSDVTATVAPDGKLTARCEERGAKP